jgi:prophage tail gpP-like protein
MDDDLTLRISSCARNGNSYTLSNPRILGGWQEVRFTRGVERCPSDFQVSMTEIYPMGNPPDIQAQPGDYCEVFLGADRVSTGWVDRVMPSFNDGAHTVTLTGRSKCQDIVDCAAVYDGFQLSNATALFIAQKLCAPFGVQAALAPGSNQGDPIAQVVILAGETAYDVLERVCRYRALLLYDTPSGDLLLSGVGVATAASGFQEGVNVERAAAVYSMDQKFSDYYAIYQGLDQFSDVGGAANQIAHLVDASVPRYRPHVVLSESMLGGSTIAEDRAKWELARRQGRSFVVRLTTDSWRDAAGVLYTPNTLAPLMLPSLKLGAPQAPVSWLIAETTYKRGRAGTTCELIMMPPQAFYQQPFIWTQFGPDQTVQ